MCNFRTENSVTAAIVSPGGAGGAPGSEDSGHNGSFRPVTMYSVNTAETRPDPASQQTQVTMITVS